MLPGASIYLLYSLTGGLAEKLLPGWRSALNHHPAFVHFPVAFWLAALLFEVVALWRRNEYVHRTAVWLLWLGTLAGTFAVLTGLQAASKVPSGAGNLLHTHKELMLISYFLALGLSALALFARHPMNYPLRATLVAGLLVLSAFMVLGTDRGAEMMGRYGFGVNGSIRREPAPPAEITKLSGPAPQYAGSKSCQPCHASIYARWKRTPMANVVRDPREYPNAVLANFSNAPSFVDFTKDQIAFVYGSIWKQNYFKKVGNEYYPLPARWDIKHSKWLPYLVKEDWWAPYYPPHNADHPTGPTCNGCHSVNYNIQTRAVTEWNVGCEDCHGPGSAHVKHPTPGDIADPGDMNYIAANNVCMQCHVQARPADSPIQGQYYDWPPGFHEAIGRIGFGPALEHLEDYWKLEPHTLGETNFYYYADGTAHKNRMQGNDFVQSLMYRRGVTCNDCHDAHGTPYPFELRRPPDEMCKECHAPDSENGPFTSTIEAHTHHKPGSAGSSCIACHMPEIETEGVPGQFVHDHTFRFITPAMTEKYGIPNACNSCHTQKSGEWAIKWLQRWYSPWRTDRQGESR
jgi:predicted CXXCH cytochrome family protein